MPRDFVRFNYLSMFSYLKSKGLPVDVLDLEVELGRPGSPAELGTFRQRARELIAARDFDLAAINCYTSFEFGSAMTVGRICREVRPLASIATGGYHPTSLPQDFMGPDSPFDFVILGEGERALAELAQGAPRREAGRPQLVHGKSLELSDDVVWDWDAYPYSRLSPAQQQISLSRGCPFECDFCIEPRAQNRSWRSFSVEKSLRLVDECVAAVKPLTIHFIDPLFGFQKSWRREFLAGLILRDHPVTYYAQLRVDMFDSIDLDLMSQLSWCYFLGVESASPEMLRIMRKTTNPGGYLRELAEILQRSSAKDAVLNLNLIFNHPGETSRTYRETLQNLERMTEGPATLAHQWSPYAWGFYPGAPEFAAIGSYEERFGTKVFHKEWWRADPACLYDFSRAAVASRELEERNGSDPYYWVDDFERFNADSRRRWSTKVRDLLVLEGDVTWRSSSRLERFRRDQRAPSSDARAGSRL